MAYWVSHSEQYSSPVIAKFLDFHLAKDEYEAGAEWSKAISTGKRAIQDDEMPSVLQLDRQPKSLPESFRSYGGINIISAAIKEIIYSFDGDMHQYWKINVIKVGGPPVDSVERFGINVHVMQSTIIDGLSDVEPNMFSPQNDSQRFIIDKGSKTRVTIARAAAGHANLWREPRYPGQLMLSDRLHDAFAEAGVTFFPHFEAKEV